MFCSDLGYRRCWVFEQLSGSGRFGGDGTSFWLEGYGRARPLICASPCCGEDPNRPGDNVISTCSPWSTQRPPTGHGEMQNPMGRFRDLAERCRTNPTEPNAPRHFSDKGRRPNARSCGFLPLNMLKTTTSTTFLLPKRLKFAPLGPSAHTAAYSTDAAPSTFAPQQDPRQPILLVSHQARMSQPQSDNSSSRQQRVTGAYFPLGYKEAAQQWVSEKAHLARLPTLKLSVLHT